MTLGILLLAIWLLATGIISLDNPGARPRFLAVLAIAAGIFLIVDSFRPTTVF